MGRAVCAPCCLCNGADGGYVVVGESLSNNVDLEQIHEDFILIPFDDVFFSNKYYDTINKTIENE